MKYNYSPLYYIVAFSISLNFVDGNFVPIYPCDSQIYCQGPILEAVNRLQLFRDSKDYVDMPLKKSANETLADFYSEFPNQLNISKEHLAIFVKEHFNECGKELIHHEPTDWQENPENFNSIIDVDYGKFAIHLNGIWRKLSKKINTSVAAKPELSSIINLPYEFVVPGGRFREVYYWDAYWIIKGLLHSGMKTTAKSMIRNYLKLVKKYGFVPNGGRIYYLMRSQPPLLSYMFNDYYKSTKNILFVNQHLQTLEKEIQFWKANRSLVIEMNGIKHTVYRYNSPVNTPRPESYKEDVLSAFNLPPEEQAVFYSNLASAAESGWDFSSRWFTDGSTFRQQKTRLILPVDLNAFVCGIYKILAKLSAVVGKAKKSNDFFVQHNECKRTMMSVFYNETEGAWFDYHLDTQKHNTEFYPSNLVPLFTETYEFDDKSIAMRKIEKYLKTSKALQYKNGIPTSQKPTGQQWDWPNAWAPLVHMVIVGLDKTGDAALKETAFVIASQWIRHNYDIYRITGHMYEKYDVVNHKPGIGGEYEVQQGFGWTNGVLIDLLVKYGSRLVAKK